MAKTGNNGGNGNGSHEIAKLPDTWNQEAIDDVLERVSQGATLKSCCRGPDARIPEVTFRRWLLKNVNGLWDLYARARELQLESWADELKELADICREGVRTTVRPDGGVETVTGDMIERAKLQIDTRKWLMSKIAPKKYGDRTDTNVNVGGTGKAIVVEINPFRGHRELMAQRVPAEAIEEGDGNRLNESDS